MNWETLYKRDSKGKIRSLSLRTENDHLITTTGIQGVDSSTVEHVKIVKGNQRQSGVDRAKSMAQSKWEKKQNEGYCLTPESAMTHQSNLPLLANQVFENELMRKVKLPVIVEPKLNGVRGLFFSGMHIDECLRSRKDKPFDKINTLDIRMLLEDSADPPPALDGELYIHGVALQDIVHLIKTKRIDTSHGTLLYYLFDMPTRDETLFVDRKSALVEWHEKQSDAFKFHVKLLQSVIIDNYDELKKYFRDACDEGFEGVMIKAIDGIYEWDRRTNAILKLKKIDCEEFEIIGVDFDTGPNDKPLIKFICETDTGATFPCVPEWTHQTRAEAYYSYVDQGNNYIGKPLTVEFRGYTKDGVPFHAVGITVRDYED